MLSFVFTENFCSKKTLFPLCIFAHHEESHQFFDSVQRCVFISILRGNFLHLGCEKSRLSKKRVSIIE
jgi:hypothetical protein